MSSSARSNFEIKNECDVLSKSTDKVNDEKGIKKITLQLEILKVKAMANQAEAMEDNNKQMERQARAMESQTDALMRQSRAMNDHVEAVNNLKRTLS